MIDGCSLHRGAPLNLPNVYRYVMIIIQFVNICEVINMSTTRTTVTMNKSILERAKKKAEDNSETLTSFLDRAVLNQLEKEDFDSGVRYDLKMGEIYND